MICRTITTRDEFATLAEPWDGLVRAMPRPCPFLLHGWLDEWWRMRGRDVTVGVHVALRGAHLVAALPLMVRRRLGVRVARFLGDGGYGVALADLLLAEAEPAETARALVRHAKQHADCLDLRDVPARSLLIAVSRGEATQTARLESPVLEIGPGWTAAATPGIPPRTRRDLGRLRRRLAEAGAVEVAVARNRDDLVPALHDAFRLHALRWHGRFDGSDFGSIEGRRFEETALVRLAALDVPRIVTLKVDGRPVAMNYYFALAGRMIGYRTAFDPELARFGPGQLNLLDAIEVGAAEGLRTVELLGGAERFKMKLADRAEPLYALCGHATSPQGRAYVAWHSNAMRLRRRLKQSPALRRLYHEGRDRMQRLAERMRPAVAASATSRQSG